MIKIVLFLITTLLAAWLLPWGYHFVVSKPMDYPFTLYSCITRGFVSADYVEGKTVYRDQYGTVYTERQFDSILPGFFYRQLIADGRLPLQIEGVEIDARIFRDENFTFRHSPLDVNAIKPALYPLLEAMSGRVDLEMPSDVFRMSSRMEFVDISTNTVLEEKSNLFTEALLDKGFEFPVRLLAGNPTTRKEYDEGYFMADRACHIFHVKKLRDRPFVRRVEISPEVRIKYIFPTEFRNRRFFGLFSDEHHDLYVLKTKEYEWQKLPLPAFDPEKENLTIFADPFYWTVKVSSPDETKLYAIKTSDYTLTDSMTALATGGSPDRVACYLFPFELSFTSFSDKFVYPRIGKISLWALFAHLILSMGYMVCKRRNARVCIYGGIILLFTGLFGLISLLFFPLWSEKVHRNTYEPC